MWFHLHVIMQCSGVAKLSAHYNSLLKPPVIITHGTPLIAVEDLNSTFTRDIPIYQVNGKFCIQ